MKQIVKYRLRKYENGGLLSGSKAGNAGLGAIGAGAGMLGQIWDDQTEDTNQAATMGSSALSMAGTGASMGAALGPLGAGVGALAGAGIGLVMGKKKADEAQAAQRLKNVSKGNAIAAAATDTIKGMPNNNISQNELKNNSGMNFKRGGRVYKKGGMINANAELERGEPYRTPDGNIGKIADTAPTHAQGGVAMNLPEGTQILGKDLFGDKMFKELGSKLKKYQDQANKSIDEGGTALSRKTAVRNLNNVQKQWDSLISLQEAQKQQVNGASYARGGVLPKYGPGTPGTQGVYREPTEADYINSGNDYATAARNGRMNMQADPDYWNRKYGKPSDVWGSVSEWHKNAELKKNSLESKIPDANYTSPNSVDDSEYYNKPDVYDTKGWVWGGQDKIDDIPLITPSNSPKSTRLTRPDRKDLTINDPYFNKYYESYPSRTGKTLNPKTGKQDLFNVIKNNIQGGINPGDWNSNNDWDAYNPYGDGTEPSNTVIPQNTSLNSTVNSQATQMQPMKSMSIASVGNNDKLKGVKGMGELTQFNKDKGSNNSNNIDYSQGEWVGLAAASVPALYNMYRGIWGKPETMNPNEYNNPYEDEIKSTLKNRKFDITQQLYENRVGRNINNYNARVGARSQSEMLNRQQLASQQYNKNVGDLYAQKNNIENQYQGEYANALVGLGGQRASNKYQIDVFNTQQRAAKNNALTGGIEQGSQAVVDFIRNRNQRKVDDERWNMLNQYMKYKK